MNSEKNVSSNKLLIICRSSSYGGSRISAAFDFILTAASFEQEVSVLFIGEGLTNLKAEQQSEIQGAKNTSKSLSAFELYGVKEVLADEEEFKSIDTDSLAVPVTTITNQSIKELIINANQVLVY